MIKMLVVPPLVVIVLWSYGQADSLVNRYLDEVVIENKMYKSIVGLDVVQIDSFLLQSGQSFTYAELARRAGLTEIRSYGSNGLTTPSLRGTGGSHTAVVWNGINVQSPLSGSADLSLLTLTAVDQISIVKGGSATQFGSGAIGGAIQINNEIEYDSGTRLSASWDVGSFGNHFQNYKVAMSTQKLSIQTNLFRRAIKNEYPYENLYTGKRAIREHAGMKQGGVLAHLGYQLSGNNLLGVRLWMQSNHIEIPTSILASDSDDVQDDITNRYQLFWNHSGKSYSLTMKSAYLNHQLDYNRGISVNTFNSWVNRAEYEQDISTDLTFISGVDTRIDQALVSSFSGEPSRSTVAAYSTLLVDLERANLSISARQEVFDGSFSPFLPSFGVELRLMENMIIKGNFSRNYRIPAFNDLYWQGAGGLGNPDLQPESSINYEVGATYMKKRQMRVSFTFFSYNVDNWILWSPISSSVWSPENVKRVWSRGIDTYVKGSFPDFGNFGINYSANHLWSLATNEQTLNTNNSKELGKQLTYTPVHSGNMSLNVSFKDHLNSLLIWSYVGTQFTEGENRNIFALPSYNTLHFSVRQEIPWDSYQVSMRFIINNILDAQYENRRGYPMMGRNFLIGLTLNFTT